MRLFINEGEKREKKKNLYEYLRGSLKGSYATLF